MNTPNPTPVADLVDRLVEALHGNCGAYRSGDYILMIAPIPDQEIGPIKGSDTSFDPAALETSPEPAPALMPLDEFRMLARKAALATSPARVKAILGAKIDEMTDTQRLAAQGPLEALAASEGDD